MYRTGIRRACRCTPTGRATTDPCAAQGRIRYVGDHYRCCGELLGDREIVIRADLVGAHQLLGPLLGLLSLHLSAFMRGLDARQPFHGMLAHPGGRILAERHLGHSDRRGHIVPGVPEAADLL
jgi:hypothetical protein